MKRTKAGEREVETLTADERKRIKNAMMYRFGAYLRPGERIEIAAEKGTEYVNSELTLEAADNSFRLDLEVAILAADQGVEEFVDPGEALDLGFEFLKLRLYEYFKQERNERFHVDWRHYTVRQTDLRFRGQMRRPELEDRADEILDDEELEEADLQELDLGEAAAGDLDVRLGDE